MIIATATEMQNNFGRYLNLVMVQRVTAERVHADDIITRNERGFAESKVVAFTPSELLARI